MRVHRSSNEDGGGCRFHGNADDVHHVVDDRNFIGEEFEHGDADQRPHHRRPAEPGECRRRMKEPKVDYHREGGQRKKCAYAGGRRQRIRERVLTCRIQDCATFLLRGPLPLPERGKR